MRTKHLFYTAAMAALFAACVNDDFETIGQQGNVANDGRPVAGDVKLNFTQAGADTRLNFGEGGYAWEASDEIGALLMDNVLLMGDAAKDKTWLQKYELVDNIHTSYRFYYDSQNEEWKADAKMLEGNYFFAYPWEDYDGNRQVAHSLINQEQNGIGGNVVAESYAGNQFFIGYSQIMAGTGTNEVLGSNVEMVPLLGAIQLRITNTGTQTYHINKVVLSGHKDLASVLTFDPTDANYGGDETDPDEGIWNLVNTTLEEDELGWGATNKSRYFNYANYLGVDGETELYVNNGKTDEDNLVYNRKDGDKYSRIEALRSVVKPLGKQVEKSAQLVINGTAEERALQPDAKNTAYVLIMCNPLKIGTTVAANGELGDKELLLSIYTDEGFVQNIDLAQLWNESADNKVVTNSKIEEVAPNISNTIEIQIDDNSFVAPDKMDIFNSADLEQFIKWNVAVNGNRNAIATLKQDVTFTADMLNELLRDKGQTTLTIVGGEEIELTLAADVPATVLDNKEIVLSQKSGEEVNLIVEGELALTEDSKKAASIEVAKEGKLTINDAKAVVPAKIENNGTLTLGANSAVKGITINNYGTMEVVKGGDSKAEVTNKKDAVINNNGYMQNVTNDKDATIVLGEGATISATENAGKIVTAKGATATVATNSGEIQYVDGAIINATGGIISTEFSGNIEEDTFKDSKVNKIIITGSAVVKEKASIANVEITEGGELIVDEKVVFTVSNELTISGEATIKANGTGENKGKVVAANVVVEEEGVLNNSGVIQANTKFEYEGIVYNNGTIYTNNLVNVDNKGTWKYNDKENIPTEPVDNEQIALNAAVEAWAAKWDAADWVGNLDNYYGYQPYNVDKFIATMVAWYNSKNEEFNKPAKALYEALKPTANTADAWGKVLKKDDGVTAIDKFDTAVDNKVVTAANVSAMTTTLIKSGKLTVTPAQDGKLYASKTEVYEAMKTALAHKNLYTSVKGITNKLAAAVWGIEETTLENAMNAADGTAPYTYIWKGCKLDEVMAVYRMLSIDKWDAALNEKEKGWSDEIENKDNLKFWMSAVLNSGNVDNSYVKKAKEVVEKYISEYQTWEYSNKQIESAGK